MQIIGEKKERSASIFSALGSRLSLEGLGTRWETIIDRRDVHGFYTFDVSASSTRVPVAEELAKAVLHIQFYSGMSDRDTMYTVSRYVDPNFLGLERELDHKISPGNEHSAVLGQFGCSQLATAWDVNVLLDPVLANFPEMPSVE